MSNEICYNYGCDGFDKDFPGNCTLVPPSECLEIHKLNVCPFCGGKNLGTNASFKKQLTEKGEEKESVVYKIICYDCRPNDQYESEKLAIEAWNKRS